MTRLLLARLFTASLLVASPAAHLAFAQQPPTESQEELDAAEETAPPEEPDQSVDDVAPRARPGQPPAAPPRAPTPPPPGPSAPGSRRVPPIPRPGPGRQITMDFNDADLQVLVKFMSELTGRNFILDERVRGKVTIISPTRITVDEAYKVFEAVLDVKGFTTVPVGAALKIIPARDAKQTGIPVTGPDRPVTGRAAGYVTRLIPLKNIAAQDLVPILTPLVSKDGSLLASQTTNTLIVTDSMDNLDRLVAIVSQLDVAGFQDRYEVIALQYATARDLAATLQQLVQPRAQAGRAQAPRAGAPAAAQQAGTIEGARIIPDERTNSLIVQATASDIDSIRNLIQQLDKEVPRSAGRINVIYLQHADAEEVAKVLAQLSPAQAAGAAARAAGGAPAPRPIAQPLPAAPAGTLPGGPVGSVAAAAAPAGTGPAAAELEGGVKVTADKATNSLIVTAAPADFEAIRSVVRQLDIRRAQVFVEALIMEVSLTRTRELGIQGQGVGRIGSAAIIAGTQTGASPFLINNNTINPVLPFNPDTTTAGGGGFGKPITITNPLTGQPLTFPSFTALVRFLNTVADVNVLSAPHLLTTNNKEAEIVVAQNIPFVTGQTSTITDPNAVQTQIDRRDVGITLRLTPTINEGDLVRLDIFQEISAVAPSPQGLDVNRVGVTTTKRSAKTSVLVQDESTIVIGGLIRDDISATENKIPLLGDIPILGYLFKTTTRAVEKTNLLIFLTPHIVRSPEEIAEITKRRQEQFQQWKARYKVEELDESGWIFDPVERSRRGGIREGFAVNEPVPQLAVRAVRPRGGPAPAAPEGPETPATPQAPPAGTDGS